jgi:hypothetical protein
MRLTPLLFRANIWANKNEGAGTLKLKKGRQTDKRGIAPALYLLPAWPRPPVPDHAGPEGGEVLAVRECGPARHEVPPPRTHGAAGQAQGQESSSRT